MIILSKRSYIRKVDLDALMFVFQAIKRLHINSSTRPVLIDIRKLIKELLDTEQPGNFRAVGWLENSNHLKVGNK